MNVRKKAVRRILGPVLALGLVTGVSVVAASPASADTAPLYTEDGIGVRVDRTAIEGPPLALIEQEMQPFVDDLILDGASDDPPVGSIQWIAAGSDLQLDFSVLDPGGSYPDGALAVHAVLHDIEIEYRVNAWWHSACSVLVWPDDATIDITAKVDINRLPDTPIEVDDISATWDDDPDFATTSFACDVHLAWNAFLNFWGDLFDSSDPESTASKIEALLEDTSQDLLDDLWTDNVEPVLASIEGFGVHIEHVYTENQGLVVRADTDATGGIEIPGFGGPFDVSDAAESGANTDLADVLSNRTNDAGDSHVIVSVHPNVVNQALSAFYQYLGPNMGTSSISGDIADVLLDPADQGPFSPNDWNVRIEAHDGFHVEPTGTGGQPQLKIPDLTVSFFNPGWQFGFAPAAVFHGELGGVDVVTEIRPSETEWGPGFASDNLWVDVSLDAGASAPAVASFDPDPSALTPFVASGIDHFNEDVFEQYLSLAPISLGDLAVELCSLSECGRYAGDENYTETFLIVEN